MSAVIDAPIPASPPARRSAGVWTAAARRFRGDRVGVASLVVVALFLLLVIGAALGLFARDWQSERGVPDAPPTFVGPAPPAEGIAAVAPSGPNVDISAIDPLAPRYKEWAEAAKKYQTTESVQ